MKKWFAAIWLICKRELFPAQDGAGRKHFLYQQAVFNLPMIGIGLLLLLVAYSGLCLVGFEQSVQQDMKEVTSSPYM